MSLTIISDLHIGAIRSAGTTPTTQYELRKHLLSKFKALLPATGDLLINGDLFDTNNIPISDVLQTYIILNEWLTQHPDSKLYNSTGNHDASKTSTVLSSFQFLGKLLKLANPERYVHVEEPMMTPHGYIIPHLRNQDLFDLALAKVPECNFLFVHANYDNGFAAQSDQSLNISRDQAEASKARIIVFGHEHHKRLAGKVVIPGNQIASSVSDWLSPQNKGYVTLVDGKLQYNISATREQEFAELDWRTLEVTDHKFIRVTGDATAEEASEVVNAINKLRKTSEAFVITNAVQISTGAIKVDFDSTLANVQSFSVMSAIKELLTDEENAVLDAL
jgi:DNA repair exonuclease SbcCD nuclease subunit